VAIPRGELFEPARSVRAFEDVVGQIRGAIMQGRLRAGDRLPSQRELQERFGVSRGTILEAIRVLEKTGLVEVRRGTQGGAIVRRLDATQVGEHLTMLFGQGGLALREMIEFRQALESQTAAWAAARAEQDDLDELARIRDEVRRLNADPDCPQRLIAEQDARFHAAVTRASRNRVSIAVMDGIMQAFRQALSYVPAGFAQRTYQDIRDFHDAIVARDAEWARRIMADHIQYFYELVLERRGGQDVYLGPDASSAADGRRAERSSVARVDGERGG
jgi:GntR family transcriptional regulator, transcriptional repressor for pyruvate dehydrogenase complex